MPGQPRLVPTVPSRPIWPEPPPSFSGRPVDFGMAVVILRYFPKKSPDVFGAFGLDGRNRRGLGQGMPLQSQTTSDLAKNRRRRIQAARLILESTF